MTLTCRRKHAHVTIFMTRPLSSHDQIRQGQADAQCTRTIISRQSSVSPQPVLSFQIMMDPSTRNENYRSAVVDDIASQRPHFFYGLARGRVTCEPPSWRLSGSLQSSGEKNPPVFSPCSQHIRSVGLIGPRLISVRTRRRRIDEKPQDRTAPLRTQRFGFNVYAIVSRWSV